MPSYSSRPPERSSGGRYTPPPNYSSRGVQLRLMTLVAAFMLVLVAMFEARDPKYLQWMWGDAQPVGDGPPLSKLEKADEDVDTRLIRKPQRDGALLPGTIIAEIEPEAEQESGDVDRIRQNGWRRALATLDRRQRTILNKALKWARDGKALDEQDRDSLNEAVALLDQSWQIYLTEALESLIKTRDEFSEEQAEEWTEALAKIRSNWNDDVKGALDKMTQGEALDKAEASHLTQLQRRFDKIALDAVEDNTLWRPADADAWFRLLEKLKELDQSTIEQASVGRVGFLPLYKQPEAYRGKVVTIRGAVRRAYHLNAPENNFGVDRYTLMWIRPAGGPNSPIAVYTLQTPEGFPPIKDRRTEGVTDLNEDVEFTGYFFKRWAYRAGDGIRTAPLLVAKTPKWTPKPPIHEQVQLPHWSIMLAAVLATAAIGAATAVWVYRQSLVSGPLAIQREIEAKTRKHLDGLKDIPSGPEVGEILAKADREPPSKTKPTYET